MPVTHRPVFSSHIDTIGYDSDAKELHVTYQNGKAVVHSDVPADVAGKVTGAASIGKAIHEHITGRYSHR